MYCRRGDFRAARVKGYRIRALNRPIVEMNVLDLCAYLGLGAVGAATLTLLLGLLIALRYSPVRQWPHRRLNIFAIHQWTAYCTVVLTLAHPTVLLFLHTPRFRLVDLLWPLHSPLQPKLNFAGAVALYLLLVILGFLTFASSHWTPLMAQTALPCVSCGCALVSS